MTAPLTAATDAAYITHNADQGSDDTYSVFISFQNTTSSYREPKMVKAMSKITETTESIKSDFKWIVTGLLTVLVGLVGIIWIDLTNDIKDIKDDQKSIENEVKETRLQLVSSLSAVEKQIAITNQKLDDLVSYLKKRAQ